MSNTEHSETATSRKRVRIPTRVVQLNTWLSSRRPMKEELYHFLYDLLPTLPVELLRLIIWYLPLFDFVPCPNRQLEDTDKQVQKGVKLLFDKDYRSNKSWIEFMTSGSSVRHEVFFERLRFTDFAVSWELDRFAIGLRCPDYVRVHRLSTGDFLEIKHGRTTDNFSDSYEMFEVDDNIVKAQNVFSGETRCFTMPEFDGTISRVWSFPSRVYVLTVYSCVGTMYSFTSSGEQPVKSYRDVGICHLFPSEDSVLFSYRLQKSTEDHRMVECLDGKTLKRRWLRHMITEERLLPFGDEYFASYSNQSRYVLVTDTLSGHDIAVIPFPWAYHNWDEVWTLQEGVLQTSHKSDNPSHLIFTRVAGYTKLFSF